MSNITSASSVTDDGTTVTVTKGLLDLHSATPDTLPGITRMWADDGLGNFFSVSLCAQPSSLSGNGITETYAIYLPPTSATTAGVPGGALTDDGVGGLTWVLWGDVRSSSPNTFSANQQFNSNAVGPTSVNEILSFYATSSGTPGTGFGQSFGFYGQSTTTGGRQMAMISVTWATATDATRKGRLTLSAYSTTNAREGFRVEGGATALISFFGVTAVARQTGDIGTGLVNLGLFSGTPTFAIANLSGAGANVLTWLATPSLTNWVTATTGLASGIGTFMATPSSANLAAAITDETGSGLLVFATSPTLTTPILGTPTSGNAVNMTGYLLANVVGATTAISSFQSDFANTGTGSDEDIFSATAVGGTNLTATGARIAFCFSLSLVAHATATRQIKIRYGASGSETTIFDTTALTINTTLPVAVIEGEIARVSTSAVRCTVRIQLGVLSIDPVVTDVTGLTLSANTLLRLTVQAAGVGAAAGDITAKMGIVHDVPVGS